MIGRVNVYEVLTVLQLTRAQSEGGTAWVTREEASVKTLYWKAGVLGVCGKDEACYDIEQAVRFGWTFPRASHLG